MRSICVDTGFLIALYKEDDDHHEQAKAYYTQHIGDQSNRLLVPWPILYETANSRLAKRRNRVNALKRDWDMLAVQRRLVLLDDSAYRDAAARAYLEESLDPNRRPRPLSLVDRVIRHMLLDRNHRIDAFITFNPGDFVDVCARSRTQLLCQQAYAWGR